MKLVAALKESSGLKGLRPESVLSRFSKYPAPVQDAARELVRQLDGKPDEQKNRLDQLESNLKGGDDRRGHLLFNSTRTACATCHPVGYLGGQVGPDLTRIGAIRTERDLLEAIIFPSASFARGFEPMVVTTRQGDEHAGIIRRENNDEVFLVSGPTAEERVPRPQIADIRPGTVSVMPEGLDQQLSRQELADLIAFLRSLK
jgi:putative heme-binding domain-containing protein